MVYAIVYAPKLPILARNFVILHEHFRVKTGGYLFWTQFGPWQVILNETWRLPETSNPLVQYSSHFQTYFASLRGI